MNGVTCPSRYRKTFLRSHIHGELHPRPQWDGRVREEVLALDNLRWRLQQAFPGVSSDVVRSAVTVTDFFYGGPGGIGTNSDLRLYLEVPITRITQEQPTTQAERERWRELSYLLRDPEVAPRGVVLRARSGAGKTVAMLKAFHDCLGPDEGAPLLGAYLPCYLRHLTADVPAIKQALEANRGDASLIEGLILHAASLPGASLDQARAWLRWSDPLLVFLDLNTAAEQVAVLLSQALPAFQHTYAAPGHRCVVAYRSFGQDKVYSNLRDLGGFAFYDLESLDHAGARRYLENLSGYETWLREQLHRRTRQPPQGDVPAFDVERLEQLIRQHIRGRDSVLGTPLLTHLFSLLRGDQQRNVHCLADLFSEVVEEYLDREYGSLEGRPRQIHAPRASTPYAQLATESGFQTGKGRVQLKTAQVRVALAILGQPTGQGNLPTALQSRDDLSSEEVLDALLTLTDPETAKRWCPAEEVWHDGDYFTQKYSRKKRAAIKKLSLLRLDGIVYRFLHDSFLYYFAALGVRCPKTPKLGLSPLGVGEGPQADPWYERVTRRLHASPRTWQLPAEFLGGLLTPEQLRVLARKLLLAEPRDEIPAVLQLLLMGRRPKPDDPILAGIELALQFKMPNTLWCWAPSALFSRVYHYLRDEVALPETARAWVDGLRQAMQVTGRPWLHSREPTYCLPAVLLTNCNRHPCVAMVDEQRVVAGGIGGQVFLWEPETKTWKVLFCHDSTTFAVAVSGDGRVVVAGDSEGCVWRAVDGQPNPKPLFRKRGTVYAVAVSGDGRVVVAGGTGPHVWRAIDGKPDSQPLFDHDRAKRSSLWVSVYAVAVSVDGRVVVSGGDDGCVWRAVDGKPDPYPLFHPGCAVLAVAVSGDGRVVVAGDMEGCVWHAVDGQPEPEPLLHHKWSVRAVAVSADGRVVVSGGDDCNIWRAVDGQPDRTPLLHHNCEVGDVAVSGDGRVVASGNGDRFILVCRDGSPYPWVFPIAAEASVLRLWLVGGAPSLVAVLDTGEILTLDSEPDASTRR